MTFRCGDLAHRSFRFFRQFLLTIPFQLLCHSCRLYRQCWERKYESWTIFGLRRGPRPDRIIFLDVGLRKANINILKPTHRLGSTLHANRLFLGVLISGSSLFSNTFVGACNVLSAQYLTGRSITSKFGELMIGTACNSLIHSENVG